MNTHETLLSLKKGPNSSNVAMSMDIENIMLRDISQRERNMLCVNLHVETPILIQTNLYEKQKQIHCYRKKLVVTSTEKKEEGQIRGKGLRQMKYTVYNR